MVERKIPNSNRGFKGVWIPSYIWLDENLTTQEMLFLVEIDSLDISDKGCYASNKHFADFFGLSKSRVSEVINSLSNKRYISITYTKKGQEIKNRNIKVFEKLNRGIQDSEGGYSENAKGSNTSFSNTKEYMSGKPDEQIPYKKIIDYLNEQANKHFKVTEKWKTLIRARWNEGQTYDDFIKVIDTKVQQWSGDATMDKYLRPVTLFGNKFDDYLNEYQPKKQNNASNSLSETQQKIKELKGEV